MINKIFPFWNYSIKRELIIGIAILILIPLILMSFNILKKQSDFIDAKSMAEAKSRTTLLATNSTVWVLANDFIGLQEVVDALNIYDDEKYTMVVDLDGKVLAHSDKSKIGKYLTDKVSVEHLKSHTHTTEVLYHSMDSSNHTIEVASPIMYNKTLLGYARTAIKHDEEAHSLETIKKDIIIYTLITIIIAIIFAYLSADTLTKSLYSLIDITKRIKNGEKNIRADENGVQEIKTLAIEFNKMLETREKMEESLKYTKNEIFQEKQKLSTIIEFIPDLLWIKDINGVYILCNKRFEDFFGFPQKEIIGKTDYDFVPRELADFFREHDKSAMNSDIPFTNEEEIQFASDGHKEYLQTTKLSIRDLNGNIMGVLGLGRDITTLKETEELMIVQSRHAAMGEMISMIAHQWRQPISAIAMGANNILADIELELLNEKVLNETANDILNKTKELSKTIDDFRNFFRPQKDKEVVSIEDIFSNTFEVVGKSLEHHSVNVIKEFDYHDKITTYSRELMQVLINILKNAKEALTEHTKEQREITISVVEGASKKISIKICNNGGTIPKDIIDKVFDPYFSTKDEKQGTGLGLYISKTIVEKHLKGTIKVKNIEDGVCFTINLPKEIS